MRSSLSALELEGAPSQFQVEPVTCACANSQANQGTRLRVLHPGLLAASSPCECELEFKTRLRVPEPVRWACLNSQPVRWACERVEPVTHACDLGGGRPNGCSTERTFAFAHPFGFTDVVSMRALSQSRAAGARSSRVGRRAVGGGQGCGYVGDKIVVYGLTGDGICYRINVYPESIAAHGMPPEQPSPDGTRTMRRTHRKRPVVPDADARTSAACPTR